MIDSIVSSENSKPGVSDEVPIDPQSLVGQTAATAHAKVDIAAGAAQTAIERLEDTCAAMCDAPRKAIRESPLIWVASAFFAGYVIGKIRSN